MTIRRGDTDDPLAGVARLVGDGESPVDVIVGKSSWQARALERASPRVIDGVATPAAGLADLLDAWDVVQLLEAGDRAALVAEVEASLAALPEASRRLWSRVVQSG